MRGGRLGSVTIIGLVAVLLAVMAAQPAAAAESDDGSLVLFPPGPTVVRVGQAVEITFRYDSIGGNESRVFLPKVEVPAGSNWAFAVEPEQFVFEGPVSSSYVVLLSVPDTPNPRSGVMRFQLTAVSGTEAVSVAEDVQIDVVGSTRVLGVWENPLPAPLDGAWGLFLLNLLAWLIIAQLTVWVIRPSVKVFTRKTKTDLDDRLLKIMGRPVVILLFTLGVKQSVEVFAMPAWAFMVIGRAWGVLLAVILVYLAYRIWSQFILEIGERVAKRTKSDLDDKLYPLFEKVGGVLIILVGIFYVVDSFGVNMAIFAAGGAVASLVLAFAAQDTLSNFFAGVQILVDRPFRVGDRIELTEQGTWGDVVQIGLRTTRIRTQDNRVIIFPNSVIGNNPVINHSFPDTLYRIQMNIGVAYGSDVELVRKTMIEATATVKGVYAKKPVEALLLDFGENALMFRLRWWIESYTDTRRMFDRVNSVVFRALKEHGIEIPFPQRVVWYGQEIEARVEEEGRAPTKLTGAESEKLERDAESARRAAEADEETERQRIKAEAEKEESRD